ncbi:MAG: glycosyltransferase family 2 protein [Bacteroidales bacterium]|nr:glycosyltransferase family 2 protein [Bacteroidales bacterium]
MTKTAVVILNWNGRAFLEQFLPEVVINTLSPDTEVIIADNGSEDDSVDWVTRNHPEVRVVRLDSNYGYAGGYNRALSQVEAEYYILLNSDVQVEPGWAEKLITFMEMHPDIGACQPKIRSYSNPLSFEYAGAAGGYIDRLGYPFCRGRIFDTLEEDHGQYDDTREIFWASGSCMAVRCTAFNQCDGFDESFFVHMEEIDLCWRLQNAGYSVCYFPHSVVKHVGGGTLGYGSPSKIYYNFRNSLIMLAKNLPDKHLHRTLMARQLLDGIAWLVLLFRQGRKAAGAVVRAHRDFRRQRTAIRTFRTLNPNAGIFLTPHTMMNKYILFEYYIRGRKNFSGLKWT